MIIDFALKVALAAFETILLILFLGTLLNQNYNRSRQKNLLYTLYFIFQLITYLIDSTFFSTCIYYIIFTLIIAYYCYLDEIKIKLIASSMFVTMNYACKLLSVTTHARLDNLILPNNPFNYVLSNQMQALASTLLLFVILIIIIMRNIKVKVTKAIVNLVIFIIPLLNLFISMDLLSNQRNIYIEITSLLFCFTFFLFFIIDQIIYTTKAELTNGAMQKRLEFQTLYYKDLQEHYNQMSRLKHDIKNHNNTLYYLISNNNIEEAKEYLESYNHQYLSVKSIINTGNEVINVILNYKINVAKSYGIDVDTKIVIPPKINISNIDISIILGNLLDNAIEACNKLEDNKKISIKIKTYKSNLFINISNSFNGKVIQENNKFITSKDDYKDHGIGILNIKHITNKYKGTMDFNYNDNQFTVDILLPDVIDINNDIQEII